MRAVELVGLSPAQLTGRDVEADMAAAALTDREREVLTWAARGKIVADTASILEGATETVEVHVRNAMRKSGALNKTHAAVLAIKAGTIDP